LIKQPIFTVMTLLSLLGDTRCAVEGVGDVSEPLGVIATRRGEDQVAVLIYNSKDKITADGSTPVTLTLRDLPFAEASLAYYRIDEDHGDPFSVWEQMGAPPRPTAEQYAAMRAVQEPSAMGKPHTVTIHEGSFTIRFDRPLPGVTLVLLSRRPDTLPPQLHGVRAEAYEGMTDSEEILVIWQGVDRRTIRTYEVQFSHYEDGPYTRINAQDQLDTAFLHVRDTDPGFYRVRAIDYWGGHGDWSQLMVR
jgi:L-iduronidase